MSRIRPPLIYASLLVLLATACTPKTANIDEEDLAPKNQSTKIFAADGSLITTLRQEENREVIAIDDVPQHVRDSVVSIEDARFYTHRGFDAKAILRAVYVNATSGKILEGGSTITQQLIRNSLKEVGKERTIRRKIKEASYAYQIEEKFSKNKILELYLNTVYFGEGAYGIQTASQTYFGKDVKDLSLAEGALLAGLIKAPVNYDPFTNADAALKRRNNVLDRMFKLGFAAGGEVAEAKGSPLGIQEQKDAFRYPAPYFIDYVTRLIQHSSEFATLGESVTDRGNLLFRGGLRIHTTLDMNKQAAAEEAIANVLDRDGDPSAALVAIEPKTGQVKALVGGRDYFASVENDPCAKLGAIAADGSVKPCAKVNLALGLLGGGSGRQSGSAFKPITLAAALDKRIPMTKTYPAPACIQIPGADGGRTWNVCNYGESAYSESGLDLREATVKSVNVVYAQLMMDTGPKLVIDTAKRMGIASPLQAVPSATLGTNPISVLDLTTAFTVFPNQGEYIEPIAITKITDAKGKVLWKPEQERHRAISAAAAYLVTGALQEVISRGTGSRYGKIGRPAFGKTGTTEEWRDGWFVGGAGTDLVAGVAVFWPDYEVSMEPSCGGRRTQYSLVAGKVIPPACRATRIRVVGGSWPTQIWQLFMLKALEGIPASTFGAPEVSLIKVEVDYTRGCLPNPYTPPELIRTQTFMKGTEPTEVCAEPSGPAQSRVPNVVGMPEDDAIRLLQNAGFAVDRRTEFSGLYPPGRITRQSPEALTQTSPGSVVTVWVSISGVEVPDVVNLSESQARSALQSRGLKVKPVRQAGCRRDDQRCFVWDQNPEAGTRVVEGTEVVIYIKPKSNPSPSPSPSPAG